MLQPAVRTLDTRTIKRPSKLLDPFYNTPAFAAFRIEVINRAGRRCEHVDNQGQRCTKAWPNHRVYADHIIELRDGGPPFDIRNGQCLCASHHESKTFLARQHRNSTWSGSLTQPCLPQPGCRVRLICGPPAAGKSTYVQDNAKAEDIVIDLDAIAQEHGFADRNRPENATNHLLRMRNDRLAALAKEPAQRTAWVILTAPGAKLRRWWCAALDVQASDLVLLVPSQAELHHRVMNDPDRKRIADLQLCWIDNWFARENSF